MRFEYPMPGRMMLAPYEITARIVLVLPKRFGPPESPKQNPASSPCKGGEGAEY
jgi:hypothetical protein